MGDPKLSHWGILSDLVGTVLVFVCGTTMCLFMCVDFAVYKPVLRYAYVAYANMMGARCVPWHLLAFLRVCGTIELISTGTTVYCCVACGSTSKACIFLVAYVWGSHPIVEQPRGNTFMQQPRWQWILHWLTMLGTPLLDNVLKMSSYYAPTDKPTSLFSVQNLDLITTVPDVPVAKRRKKDGDLPNVIKYVDSQGRDRFKGGPGLKSTQEYTLEFGRGVSLWFLVNEDALKTDGLLSLFSFEWCQTGYVHGP